MNAPATRRAAAARAAFDVDARTGAAALDSIVLRGDLSGLGPDERARFYAQMCEGLGLNPHAQPFAFLRLNGKEVLYATRGATDQLAAMHQVTREIIDGPKVIDLGGTPLVYCVCRASLPGGRFETAVATVPMVDPVNVLMKAETKAKRRATLSLLGLGLLDEMEVETIPAGALGEAGDRDVDVNADLRAAEISTAPRGAVERPAAPQSTVAGAPADADPPPAPVALSPAVAALLALAGAVASPEAAVALWVEHRATLSAASERERVTVKKALARRIAKVGDAGVRSLPAAEGYLRSKTKLALAAADAAPPAPPAITLVPAGPASGPAPDPEAVLLAFAAEVAEVRLPGEAAALWLARRAALAALPREAGEAAFRGLCAHVEQVARMSNAKLWLKKAVAEADAQRADGSALAGAA